jgi:hypothetical protein
MRASSSIGSRFRTGSVRLVYRVIRSFSNVIQLLYRIIRLLSSGG